MDLTNVETSIIMLSAVQQQQFQRPVLTVDETDVQDWRNLRQELVDAVGGLDQLNKELREDKKLAKEWLEAQESITAQLQHISRKLDQVGEDVCRVLDVVEQIKAYMRSGRKSYKPKLLLSASDVQIHADKTLDEGTFAEVYSGTWDGTDVAVKQFKMLGVRQDQADEVRAGLQ